ncbi:MAG: beta galactosidase jelly roll domain-containing protein [Treponema sp.]|jgi:beta-galactosidase/beta-glucuronidase|nr:beta galactosidase jelly roll domain-containing protein [Treponema sp.]
MKSYIPDYPRPQFVRPGNSWENLNGPWDFAFDDANEGTGKAWFRNFPQGRVITVPFTCETEAGGIGDQKRHDVVWYRRTVNIKKPAGKKVFIHFEGSDYRTSLWVNGSFAGTHDGAYARFSFDITHLVSEERNEIVVRVEDSFDTAQPRGKQRWKNENFACWYVQTTGIWKTVWLEYVPEARIASVKITPLFQEGKVRLECTVDGKSLVRPELAIDISFQDKRAAGLTVQVLRGRVETEIDIRSTDIIEWGIVPWAPGCPGLYDIAFRLLEDGKVHDEVLSYFGMREIRIDGPNILLNGSPLYQRLVLDQGYWKDSHLTPPDEQALISDIDRIMAMGYNGVRKHQKTEDEKFLYWADVKGLLVWSEMASAYEYSDEGVTKFTREWMEVVRQHYNHPSIIVWTPFNESWGIPLVKTDPSQQHFTEAIYHLTKSYDKYRPVICNDGWEHTISDIITLHDYEERGEDFLDRYQEHLEEILDNKIYHNTSRSAFADGFAYRGQPVILSEFGGIAFSSGNPGWGYGSKVDSAEEFIKRFDAITTAIKKIDLFCGYCYTQVTDVQQEINGLMDIERNCKVDPAVIREINERKIGNLRHAG